MSSDRPARLHYPATLRPCRSGLLPLIRRTPDRAALVLPLPPPLLEKPSNRFPSSSLAGSPEPTAPSPTPSSFSPQIAAPQPLRHRRRPVSSEPPPPPSSCRSAQRSSARSRSDQHRFPPTPGRTPLSRCPAPRMTDRSSPHPGEMLPNFRLDRGLPVWIGHVRDDRHDKAETQGTLTCRTIYLAFVITDHEDICAPYTPVYSGEYYTSIGVPVGNVSVPLGAGRYTMEEGDAVFGYGAEVNLDSQVQTFETHCGCVSQYGLRNDIYVLRCKYLQCMFSTGDHGRGLCSSLSKDSF